MLSNLHDIEHFCDVDNWNGNHEWAIQKETIEAAKAFMVSATVVPDEIHAEDTGYIRLVFYVSHSHNVEILIHEKQHTIGLFTNNITIEKTLQNKYIKRTGIHIQYLTMAYQYFC